MIPYEVILSICAPIIGGLIGIIKAPKKSVVYHLLAFAGGVMLAITFIDLIPSSINYSYYCVCIYGLIIGFGIMFLLHLTKPKERTLKETATFLAIGMGIHNFSEGMAIAITSKINLTLSFVVATSIIIHNFAEGLCTVSPLYYSSQNKLKAFLITSFTALPLLLGYLFIEIFFQSISSFFLGFLLAITAGLMLNITVTELIPESANNHSHYATEFSLILGILIVLVLEYI